MEDKKVIDSDEDIEVLNDKLTYDDIVRSKSPALNFKNKKANIKVMRVLAISLIIIAIIFGSLLIFHVI